MATRFPHSLPEGGKGGPEGLETGYAFTDITAASNAGKWKLVFFWPKDFTFVCPTEIVAFGKLARDFADRDTVVYGVSIDSEFVHMNWRLHHDDLRNLPIPMLADVKRELAAACGVLDKNEGVALRATFVVDPDGHHPLCRGERSVSWPQSGGGAARAGCIADRRTLPMQLEQGRAGPAACGIRAGTATVELASWN